MYLYAVQVWCLGPVRDLNLGILLEWGAEAPAIR